ncbi:MAG: efflux RND transporter periplasmic adaptor subunit [Kineosporiaceae bacterium]|nr:efflux RND transporter periplasmic adaptor subunit [Kineosporiaceae bacterium]
MSTRSPSRLIVPRTAVLAPLVSLVVTATVLTGCTEDSPTGIELGQVTRATVTEVVEAPATVTARASAIVSAPSAGTVVSLAVREGQVVAAGQVLLTIDSPGARQALAQAEGADAEAASAGGVTIPRADLSVVSDAGRRAAEAIDQARQAAEALPEGQVRAAALARVESARAEHEAARRAASQAVRQLNAGLSSLSRLASSLARAQRAQTRAAVTAAQAAVDSLTVRSPIAGTVIFGGSPAAAGAAASGSELSSALDQVPPDLLSQLGSAGPLLSGGGAGGTATVADLAVGTPVTAGATLLTVTDVSELGLTASVDETDVVLVRPQVPAEIELDALPGMRYPAAVRSVDLQPTASARGGVTYQVRLRLDPAGPSRTGLRPGMSAVARLHVRTADQAVSVPASAVFRDERGDAVWRVTDGIARRVPVRLGAQGADRVEITDGVTVGDQVIVRGADRVSDGQRVQA